MATFYLGMATFFLGMATLFLGLATFFLGIIFFQNGYILVPHHSEAGPEYFFEYLNESQKSRKVHFLGSSDSNLRECGNVSNIVTKQRSFFDQESNINRVSF